MAMSSLSGSIHVAPETTLRVYDHDSLDGTYHVVGITIGDTLDVSIGPGFLGDAAVAATGKRLIAAIEEVVSAAQARLDAEWAAVLPFDAPDPITAAKAAADRAEEDGPDDAHNPYLDYGGAGDSGYRASMADAGLAAKVRA